MVSTQVAADKAATKRLVTTSVTSKMVANREVATQVSTETTLGRRASARVHLLWNVMVQADIRAKTGRQIGEENLSKPDIQAARLLKKVEVQTRSPVSKC